MSLNRDTRTISIVIIFAERRGDGRALKSGMKTTQDIERNTNERGENALQIRPCKKCHRPVYLKAVYGLKDKQYSIYVRCDRCRKQSEIYHCKNNPAGSNFENDACQRAVANWNEMQTKKESKKHNERVEKKNRNFKGTTRKRYATI